MIAKKAGNILKIILLQMQFIMKNSDLKAETILSKSKMTVLLLILLNILLLNVKIPYQNWPPVLVKAETVLSQSLCD